VECEGFFIDLRTEKRVAKVGGIKQMASFDHLLEGCLRRGKTNAVGMKENLK